MPTPLSAYPISDATADTSFWFPGSAEFPPLYPGAANTERVLSETAITVLAGLFPGAGTFPGSSTFPGHGTSLSGSLIVPRVLTEVAA